MVSDVIFFWCVTFGALSAYFFHLRKWKTQTIKNKYHCALLQLFLML